MLNGDDAWSVLRLTPAEDGQAGSAYLEDPFAVTDGGGLITKVDFRMDGADGFPASAGFALVIQNAEDGATTLNATGAASALGLEEVENSIAIAFQTETGFNHVGLFTNGNMNTEDALAREEFNEPLNDGTIWYAWIIYDGTTDLLEVFLTDTNSETPPTGDPVLSATIAIDEILGDQAYAGFSSATGSNGDNHDILAWTLGAFDYQTYLNNDGARHVIAGPYLGDGPPDAEINGLTTLNAMGDDDIGDDEDSLIGFTPFIEGGTSQIEFLVGGAPEGAFFDAWIDFNGNGMFDADEHVNGGTSIPVVNGANTIDVMIPAGSFESTGGVTYSRARISSSGNLGPSGLANDGEVEDYLIEIVEGGDEPILNISDGTIVEADSGEQFIEFTVTRSHNVGEPSVPWFTADDTATAGEDYTASSGTVTFEDGGSLTQTIQVPVLGDEIVELDETFFVNLGAANCAVIGDSQAVGTIENDDSATISITNVSQTEGDDGTKEFRFEISIDAEVDEIVTFNAATADGSAVAASGDYEVEEADLMLRTPEMDTFLSVIVVGDTIEEADEDFFVNLTNLDALGRDVAFETSQARGVIRDDDTPPPPGGSDCSASRPDHGTYIAEDGTLFVVGTNGNDHLRTVESLEEIRVFINDEDSTFSRDGITNIVMCGLRGRDLIDRDGKHNTLPSFIDGGRGPDSLNAGKGDDTVIGGNADDLLRGNEGNDILLGGSGNDGLDGEDGHDFLNGGSGKDRLRGRDGNDTLLGSHGNDQLFGGNGHDLLKGQNGNDKLVGGNGNDILDGGNHNDRLLGGSGKDIGIGGAGSDNVKGGFDNDIVIAGSSSLSDSQLQSILMEWTTSDRSLTQRIANIRGDEPGERHNGTAYLNSTTLTNDEANDNLYGEAATDWFFAAENDRLKDRLSFEELDLL